MLPTHVAASLVVELWLLGIHISVAVVITCVINRLMKYEILPANWMQVPPLGGTFFFVTGFTCFFEFIAHTLIAPNRYTAFVCPLQHEQVWRGKKLAAIVGVQATIALVLASNRFGMQFVIIQRSWTVAYINTVDWIQSTTGVLAVAISVTTMVLSAILEIRTLIEYRRLSRNRKHELHEDFRLLVYALLSFISQSIMAAYFSISCFGANTAKTIVLQEIFPYTIDILALGNSLCLLLTSRTLRRAYCHAYGCSSVLARNPSSVVRSPTTLVRISG
ncbi:hypothetical protein AAVH_19192 [Aphelenchoides avenae]|nr:hypothetical protein AAVH_19192 [Aphelenchus avenae]